MQRVDSGESPGASPDEVQPTDLGELRLREPSDDTPRPTFRPAQVAQFSPRADSGHGHGGLYQAGGARVVPGPGERVHLTGSLQAARVFWWGRR
jgi:hypothetical protein